MKHNNLDLSQADFLLFLQGDQRIFRMVFNRYYPSIFRYVQSLTQNQQEIDDIVQQCFIQLFNHKSAIQSPDGVYPYLFVIAQRFVIMAFRKRVREAKYQTQSVQTQDARCDKTENQIDFNDLQRLLSRFIELLPPKQREIYRLSKLDGYSYEEISLATGCAKNTVKNHLVAASKKIRVLVSRHYLTFSAFFIFLH